MLAVNGTLQLRPKAGLFCLMSGTSYIILSGLQKVLWLASLYCPLHRPPVGFGGLDQSTDAVSLSSIQKKVGTIRKHLLYKKIFFKRDTFFNLNPGLVLVLFTFGQLAKEYYKPQIDK